MQIFTNVEFGARHREGLASDVAPDEIYFGDPEQLSTADRTALLQSEIAFGSCPPDLLIAARELRWLQLDSVGCDQYRGLDWERLSQRLTVTNLRGFFAVPVAETGIASALALYRAIDRAVELRRLRSWRQVELRSQLRTLAGANALVAGYGAIGHALESRLTAFGSIVRTFGSPSSAPDLSTLAELDDALPQADMVFLALPETDRTTGMFGAERLNRLKAGAILVNLGRGSVVNEDALLRLLANGVLAGAALDVTQAEPLPPDSPLWTAPNLILTQHTAGGSAGELDGKADVFLANLMRYRSGLPLSGIVDWAKGY
jgi:glyoxylate/hydroxypyruvate reductase